MDFKNNSTTESGTIILWWNYTQKDFFEERFCLEQDDCLWEFNEGSAMAKMCTIHEDGKRRNRLKKDLVAKIEIIFNGAQIITQKPYEISESCMEGYDSKDNLWITPTPAYLNLLPFETRSYHQRL